MRQNLRMHLHGLLWLTAAAALLAALPGIRPGVGPAWALTVPFLLAAGALLHKPGPWFEGIYAAGFLVRLLALGSVMAASSSRDLPAALALSLFALELVGLVWLSRCLPRRAAC